MHICQPALSRAIGRLEAQLGVELFDRRGRVVALNHHGRRYLAYAQRALDELDAGAAALSDLADAERGELRLWFLHTLGSWMVPALVGAFREDHPTSASGSPSAAARRWSRRSTTARPTC